VWAAVRTPQAFRFVTRDLLDWRPLAEGPNLGARATKPVDGCSSVGVDGAPYMVSFWELRDGRIARDVSIVLRNTSAAS